jgi:LmbE family N-acetylglucosaminyl deacetylase
MYTYENIFARIKSVLVIVAHPDDADVLFGGIIAKLCSQGVIVSVVVVTDGSRGSQNNVISDSELGQIRKAEQIKSLGILGVSPENINFLNFKEAEVESDIRLIERVSYMIRAYKPEMVFTHDPSMVYAFASNNSGAFIQHRDHRKVGEATLDAVFPFARDLSFFREHHKSGLTSHTVTQVILSDESGCNLEVQIDDFIEIKRAALLSHNSQFSLTDVNEIIEENLDKNSYSEKFQYLNLLW